jgi:uncharacterized membrane protein
MASCKKVPPGTNGGVSLRGTAAAMAGGAFMGLVFWVFGWLQMGRPEALAAELLPLALIGLLAGLVGSTIDSALGEHCQASWINLNTKKVCGHGLDDKADPKDYKLICGRDLLSNEMVNVVSVTLTSGIAAMMAEAAHKDFGAFP